MATSTIYRYTHFFLLTLFILSCQSAPSNTQLFKEELIDLGKVNSGGKVDFKVDLRNPVDKPIKLVDVEGTCGCIKVKNYPKELNVDQDGIINATYDSKFDLAAKGIIYKNIVVKLDKKPYLHAVKLKINLR